MPDNLEPISQTPATSPIQPEPDVITPQSPLPPTEPNPISSPSLTTVTPELPPTQPSNNSPKPNRFLIALLLCFVLVAGGVGGFYARSFMPLSENDADTTNQNQITDVDTTSPSQPEPTSDPTADWETFSNTAYSFKHPQDWKVTANLENELPKDQKYIGDKIVIVSPAETVGIIVTTGEYPWGGTGEESMQSAAISFSINGNDYQSNETVVNNHSVRAGTSIPLNNKVYTVLFGSGYPITNDPTASLEDYKRDKNTVLQILSTFQFKNQNSISKIPAGWLTIKNSIPEEMRSWPDFKDYTLHYPPTWKATYEKNEKDSENPNPSTRLILSKKFTDKQQDYFEAIQTVGGGGNCVFPEDSDFDTFQGMGEKFQTYQEISHKAYVWRLAKRNTPGTSQFENTHVLCQKTKEASKNPRFVNMTALGFHQIRLYSPDSESELIEILKHVDVK